MDYVYVNEDSIERLLKCPICSKPFIDPVITRDGDRFCRLCITHQTSIVNTSVFDQQSSFIDNLVSINERLLHEMLDNLFVKCLDCQRIDIHRKDFHQHLLTQCPKRIVQCKAYDLKCPWSGCYDQSDDHITKCTFELLRPILSETCQFQKELEQYRTSSHEQQLEIEKLKKQIEQYEDRTEKLQKGLKIFLDMNSQQKNRYEKFQDDIQEFQKYFTEQNLRQNKLLNEIQQLKEQYSHMNVLYEQSKHDLSQQNLRQNKLLNEIQQLKEQYSQMNVLYEQFQQSKNDLPEQNLRQNKLLNEIQQLKEQYNQMNILYEQFQQSKYDLPEQNLQQSNEFKEGLQQMKEHLNQYELQIKKYQEQNSNYDKQMKQLQKEDTYRKNELLRIRQISDQHDIQIRLLARKKCVVPARSPITTDARLERLLERFPSNAEIDLDGKHFENQEIEFICKTAIVDKKCRKLRLENNGITAKGISILADALYGNTTLVELHLSNNCISDLGAHALAQVLSINNGTLAWLEIHANTITDEGAEYLAEMLKTNKTLILLGLSFNRISDHGVQHLASSIAYYNETLQWLHLSSNKEITDGSVGCLVDMFRNNKSLQALWLNDCSLSTNGKKQLRQVVESNKDFILDV